MTNRTFTIDLGRMMDEAFRLAEQLGESFGADAAEATERLRQAAEAFGHGAAGAVDAYPAYLYPPANIYLTRDKRMVLEIALAGFEEKDISVQFRGDYLVFSARVPQGTAEAEEGIQYFKRRLRMRDVEEQRYFVPTDKFDQAATEATFKNGLLRIVVPAREQPAENGGIRIAIRTDGAP
jgi:HSP20 family protein